MIFRRFPVVRTRYREEVGHSEDSPDIDRVTEFGVREGRLDGHAEARFVGANHSPAGRSDGSSQVKLSTSSPPPRGQVITKILYSTRQLRTIVEMPFSSELSLIHI